MTMIQALRSAMDVMMERDENVVVYGQDVGYFGGVFRVTDGLQAKYGKHRAFDAPISEGGIVGTAVMLAECSGVAINIELNAIPKPAEVALERWLLTFPSFGYLLSVKPWNVAETLARFAARGIAAAVIGAVSHGSRVSIGDGASSETIWDFAQAPLIGAGGRARVAMGAVA